MPIDPYEEPVGYRVFLEVRPSKLGGLGVFTQQSIPDGAVIERAPVTLLTKEELKSYDRQNTPCRLANYLFQWDLIPPDNSDNQDKKRVAFGHGFSSLYNCQFNGNASSSNYISSWMHARSGVFFRNIGTRYGDYYPNITFIAVKDIPAGSEITTNYNPYGTDKESWMKGIIETYGQYVDAQGPLTSAPVESLSPLDRQRFESWKKARQYGDEYLEGIVQKVIAFREESQNKKAK